MARFTRRGLLQTALAGACSAAAHPWLTPVAMAAVPSDNRLVVIVLRGAMDGLDVVRPMADPLLGRYRPTILDGARGKALDAGFEMHPELDPLAPLWDAGELGFAHAVSTPYRDQRSHFDGQDLLEAGTPGLPAGSVGWLNRLLAAIPGSTGETAFAVGSDTQLILAGPERHSSWTPGTDLRLSAQARRLLDRIYQTDPAFAAPAAAAIRIADETRTDAQTARGAADALAAFAADRLRRDTRIAAFSITGWDTHQGQQRAIRRPLTTLTASIQRLRADLGEIWAKTAVVAMTEFGRTVRENGSAGTDHGTAGVMLLAGGAIRGGKVFGTWPGLGEGQLYQDRDLMPTEDVRAYAAAALRGLYGLSPRMLQEQVFPGLDMSRVPQITA
jgi:uncharacterized protein (DUF1501 family)